MIKFATGRVDIPVRHSREGRPQPSLGHASVVHLVRHPRANFYPWGAATFLSPTFAFL